MNEFNEPWNVREEVSASMAENLILGANGLLVAMAVCSGALDNPAPFKKAEEVAGRIVACVNALAGVSDPVGLMERYREMLGKKP